MMGHRHARAEVTAAERSRQANPLPPPRRAPPRSPGEEAPSPSLNQLWLLVALTVTLVVVNTFPVDQTDYWWTVKLGDDLWATGQLPTANTLAFTPTRAPYVEQQWLAQLVLSAVHSQGGLHGALLLRAALVTIAMGLLYHLCRRAGASPAIAGIVTIASLTLVVPAAAARPQLLAVPLFTLFLAATTLWLDRRWPLVVLPLGMVLWVNLHGSFPLGLALVGCALLGAIWGGRAAPRRLLAERIPRRLAVLWGLCSAAALVNPYGLQILPWLVDFLTVHAGSAESSIKAAEWLPTSVDQRVGLYYFASVLVLTVVLIRVGPPRPADAVRLVLFGLLALTAIRSTSWWGLVQAPVLAWGAARLLGPAAAIPPGPGAPGAAGLSARARALLHAGLAAVCVLGALWSVPLVREALGVQDGTLADPTQPRGAAEYLPTRGEAHRLFNYLDWGGYLGWRLAPAQQTFVDERYGVYAPAVFRDYARIGDARPGWDTLLGDHGVDAIVVSRQHQPELSAALAGHDGWGRVYCDVQAEVYLRRDLLNRAHAPTIGCPPADREPRAGASVGGQRTNRAGLPGQRPGSVDAAAGPRRDENGSKPPQLYPSSSEARG